MMIIAFDRRMRFSYRLTLKCVSDMNSKGDCLTHAHVREQTLFGHPKGFFFLAFTEAREQFSFYGMAALVVLYMVDQLLLPGMWSTSPGTHVSRGH